MRRVFTYNDARGYVRGAPNSAAVRAAFPDEEPCNLATVTLVDDTPDAMTALARSLEATGGFGGSMDAVQAALKGRPGDPGPAGPVGITTGSLTIPASALAVGVPKTYDVALRDTLPTATGVVLVIPASTSNAVLGNVSWGAVLKDASTASVTVVARALIGVAFPMHVVAVLTR